MLFFLRFAAEKAEDLQDSAGWMIVKSYMKKHAKHCGMLKTHMKISKILFIGESK